MNTYNNILLDVLRTGFNLHEVYDMIKIHVIEFERSRSEGETLPLKFVLSTMNRYIHVEGRVVALRDDLISLAQAEYYNDDEMFFDKILNIFSTILLGKIFRTYLDLFTSTQTPYMTGAKTFFSILGRIIKAAIVVSLTNEKSPTPRPNLTPAKNFFSAKEWITREIEEGLFEK